MELVRSFLNKISVEQIKIELLNTAYGNGHTFLARLDPRTLILWYLFFAIAPWFIFNEWILFGLLALMTVTTVMSRVSPLIIVILIFGLVSQVGYLFVFTLFFGGSLEGALPLLVLTMKLSVISLASITVFSSLDPERLSDGLLSLGLPGHVSFSIAYGYRILPTLLEEYHHLFLSFRLRGRSPGKNGFLYWRSIYYFIKISILCFYPLFLSTAKRARTTVEALETRGFTYAFNRAEVKRLKLSYLRFSRRDGAFIACSAVYVAAVLWIGGMLP
ncbi:energy-coupling factor transporter transmembrane component T family protein [Paenibacillus beijingensis]|uniref:Cobalt transporter n=1 Tax=Paenibacillus beijingensis TaxID=1126833 RepID=A0A0D5NDW9_9BACL|nr:energy-coupling factor transporter transmembrane component T [Paenibacillus beijingensis]AJY73441.1 cobalt transporter [Paenibacillus beijingensis]